MNPRRIIHEVGTMTILGYRECFANDAWTNVSNMFWPYRVPFVVCMCGVLLRDSPLAFLVVFANLQNSTFLFRLLSQYRKFSTLVLGGTVAPFGTPRCLTGLAS